MKKCLVVAFTVIALFLAGCGPSGPAVGSPEWLYQAARESYAAGDLEKAAEHLEKVADQGENEFAERARVWRALIETGLANAHMELADAYDTGWRQTRTEKADYARQKSTHLKEARRHAIHVVECYDGSAKQPAGQAMVLDFAFPRGTSAPVTELDRVYKGMQVPDAMRDTVRSKARDRGLVRAVSSVLTTADDSAGAQNAMKDGRAEVPPAKMITSAGITMHELAKIFDSKNLNEPDKLKIFHERAIDAARRAQELNPDEETLKAAKKLQGDAEKALAEIAKKRRG